MVYIMCSACGQMYELETYMMERKMLDFLGFPRSAGYSFMCAEWSK